MSRGAENILLTHADAWHILGIHHLTKEDGKMTMRTQKQTKYQINGRDSLWGDEYSLPELYDTYEEAFAKAHSRHEWVRKVEAQ